jgi:hypothetical protein
MVIVHDANLPDGKQAVEVLTNLFFWFFTIQLISKTGVSGAPQTMDCGTDLLLVRLVSMSE